MTITKITYMQTFPTGSFANIKLGAEAEVGAREDIVQAMDDLKKVVNDAFKAIVQTQDTGVVMLTGQQTYSEFSSYQRHEEPLPRKSEAQISREQQIEGYYEIIKMAKTKKALELHRPGIERMKDDSLTLEFNNKIDKLQ